MGHDPASMGTLIGAKPPSEFSPSDLANLVAWYKADAITGLNDGDPVVTWADSSGNGYDVTQGTAANRPTYETNELNSLPIVRFDGANDYLADTTFVDFGDSYSAFAVALFANEALDNWAIFEVSTGTVNTGFSLMTQGAWNTVGWRCIDSGGSVDLTGTDTTDGVARIYSCGNDGSNLDFRENAVDKGTQAYTSPNPNTLDQIDIGQLAFGGYYLKGDIAEIIIYSDNKTGADLGNLETHLSDKYNISI